MSPTSWNYYFFFYFSRRSYYYFSPSFSSEKEQEWESGERKWTRCNQIRHCNRWTISIIKTKEAYANFFPLAPANMSKQEIRWFNFWARTRRERGRKVRVGAGASASRALAFFPPRVLGSGWGVKRKTGKVTW